MLADVVDRGPSMPAEPYLGADHHGVVVLERRRRSRTKLGELDRQTVVGEVAGEGRSDARRIVAQAREAHEHALAVVQIGTISMIHAPCAFASACELPVRIAAAARNEMTERRAVQLDLLEQTGFRTGDALAFRHRFDRKHPACRAHTEAEEVVWRVARRPVTGDSQCRCWRTACSTRVATIGESHAEWSTRSSLAFVVRPRDFDTNRRRARSRAGLNDVLGFSECRCLIVATVRGDPERVCAVLVDPRWSGITSRLEPAAVVRSVRSGCNRCAD